jgi:hypothetical protein
MSLDEWSDEFGYMVHWDRNGWLYLILDDACEKAKSALYSLRDFKVSSVVGHVYYIVRVDES